MGVHITPRPQQDHVVHDLGCRQRRPRATGGHRFCRLVREVLPGDEETRNRNQRPQSPDGPTVCHPLLFAGHAILSLSQIGHDDANRERISIQADGSRGRIRRASIQSPHLRDTIGTNPDHLHRDGKGDLHEAMGETAGNDRRRVEKRSHRNPDERRKQRPGERPKHKSKHQHQQEIDRVSLSERHYISKRIRIDVAPRQCCLENVDHGQGRGRTRSKRKRGESKTTTKRRKKRRATRGSSQQRKTNHQQTQCEILRLGCHKSDPRGDTPRIPVRIRQGMPVFGMERGGLVARNRQFARCPDPRRIHCQGDPKVRGQASQVGKRFAVGQNRGPEGQQQQQRPKESHQAPPTKKALRRC
mmetsp:Transcript_20303/g.42245  ORF Transcript_20303/g.42245 Transcript_20303/m.42245 type:complete len:358 (+) Transcript_20303:366-1439(+)